MLDPSLWFLVPVGMLIAVLGMSAGISSSNFWTPFYLIIMGLDPGIVFWLSLLTMTFGYGSGLVRNLLQGTIHWPTARRFMKTTIPTGILGGLLAPYAPEKLLLIGFAVFVFIYGLFFTARFFNNKEKPPLAAFNDGLLAVFAGFCHGLIATGMGKLILPRLLHQPAIKHHSTAVGTTVFLVFTVSLSAMLARLNPAFLTALSQQQDTLVSTLVWVVPSVVIGGQIGPMLAKKLPERFLKLYVGLLLVVASVLIFYRAIF